MWFNNIFKEAFQDIKRWLLTPILPLKFFSVLWEQWPEQLAATVVQLPGRRRQRSSTAWFECTEGGAPGRNRARGWQFVQGGMADQRLEHVDIRLGWKTRWHGRRWRLRKEGAGSPSETLCPIRFPPRALTSIMSCSAPASNGKGGGELINSAKCL